MVLNLCKKLIDKELEGFFNSVEQYANLINHAN